MAAASAHLSSRPVGGTEIRVPAAGDLAEHSFDVLVVGGGIAGVSIAYELAATERVCLLEAESTLAYHTTGRSAAAFLETYGNLPVRAMTVASRTTFTEPPDMFDGAISKPMPMLYIAREGRSAGIEALHAQVRALTPDASIVDASAAEQINPLLKGGAVELGMVEPGALDVDVHALHQGYVRGFRARGGRIVTSARVVAAERRNSIWTLFDETGNTYRAPIVVNSAGAWCDQLADVLGAPSVGIRPLRRTVFFVPVHDSVELTGLPLTIDVDDTFYFKPEQRQLLCSPSDETPHPPADVRPDELAIARALDAINDVTTINARHVSRSWAGLRSFTPDRTPVVGYAREVEGVFWYAGQGGYGIQMSPAMARVGAALLRGAQIPADVRRHGLEAAMLDPSRPGLRAPAGTE